jgi:hypothetical protein
VFAIGNLPQTGVPSGHPIVKFRGFVIKLGLLIFFSYKFVVSKTYKQFTYEITLPFAGAIGTWPKRFSG